MRNKPGSALWMGILLFTMAAVGSGLAQSGKQPRLSTTKVKAVRSTSFAAAVLATSTQATEQYKADSDAEARRRDVINKFAADRLQRSSLKAALAAPLDIPHVPGYRISEHHGAQGFAGISAFTMSALTGFVVEPPDQGLCAGNGFVLEAVNDSLSVYSNGGQVLGSAALTPFFGSDPALNQSDPRCLYDSATDRWFVTAVQYDNFITSIQELIAVSTSGNPLGSYQIYALDVSNDGSDFFPGDCPCLGDQPLIGANGDGFYLSTNAFGFFSFQGAQVYALSKSQLASGSATVNAVHFDQLSFLLPDVEFSFSIQPSFAPPADPGDPGTEYLAQAMRALQVENRMAVWSINNTGAINSNPAALTMSVAVIPSEVYAMPVKARQKAGPVPLAEHALIGGSAPGPFEEQNLDGNDTRMQQVMFRNGKLWTALGTSLDSPASGNDLTSTLRDGAAWFVIDVSNSSGLQANISSQGYVAGPDNSNLVYPAVAVNGDGRAAMVFTLAGPNQFPSAAYWSFGKHSIHIASPGALPEDGFSAYYFSRPRWGDYSAAAVTADGSIWMATEMIPSGVRRRFANWGTFVTRVNSGDDQGDDDGGGDH